MKYSVVFNCAGAIAKMPAKRRNWERQLIDDFTRAIHGKRYLCENRDELMCRLKFIAGRGEHGLSERDEDNRVTVANEAYGERDVPVQMYGFAQGYVDFEELLKLLDCGASFVFIRFNDFYDLRQRSYFGGCYIEIIPCGEEV